MKEQIQVVLIVQWGLVIVLNDLIMTFKSLHLYNYLNMSANSSGMNERDKKDGTGWEILNGIPNFGA